MMNAMKSPFLSLWVVAALSTITTPSTIVVEAQEAFCPSLNYTIDTTAVGDDFTHLQLEPSCPNGRRIPESFHYHIRTVPSSSSSASTAIQVTASEANLVVPYLNPSGVGLDLHENWTGTGAVGVEIALAAANAQSARLAGVQEKIHLQDDAGSIQVLEEVGALNTLYIVSAVTGTLEITLRGASSDIIVDAPMADLQVTLNGDEHDFRTVQFRTLQGTITGTRNKIVVGGTGEVVTVSSKGVSNEILINTGVNGGCDKVVEEGINNDCSDNTSETVEISTLDCVSPEGTTPCTDAATGIGMIGPTVAAVVFMGMWSLLA